MAKVDNADHSKRHGKLNKKDNEIHRVRNGKEHVYSIRDEYNGPASEAQNANRSNFGKISAIMNRIIADPVQAAEWKQRFEDFNRGFVYSPTNHKRPYQTLHQFIFAVIRKQIDQTPPPPTQLPKGVSLHIRTFADLSAAEIYEILKARYAVFTEEPQIYRTEKLPQAFLLGRMLTTERGQGFGARLMHSIIAETKRQGGQILRLHAQTQAVPFYEHLGFHTVGEVFIEADIPHILMEMSL